MEINSIENVGIVSPKQIQRKANISYGKNDLERQPNQDEVVTKKSHTGRNIAIGASLVTLGLATWAFFKGKTEGVEKTFMKQMKDGFDVILHRTPKIESNDVSRVATDTSEHLGNAGNSLKQKTLQELLEMKNTLDETNPDYHKVLEEIFAKTTDNKDKIKVGEELAKYWEDISANKIQIKSENSADLFYNEANNLRHVKADLYADLSHVYKHENEIEKAFEWMKKASDALDGHNASIIGELAKLHALKGSPAEGIKIALKKLELYKDEVYCSEQQVLLDGIVECLKKQGQEDLAKTIELLGKGSQKFEDLTLEDIKFLIAKNIDYANICGNGGREQSGALAKWVMNEITPARVSDLTDEDIAEFINKIMKSNDMNNLKLNNEQLANILKLASAFTKTGSEQIPDISKILTGIAGQGGSANINMKQIQDFTPFIQMFLQTSGKQNDNLTSLLSLAKGVMEADKNGGNIQPIIENLLKDKQVTDFLKENLNREDLDKSLGEILAKLEKASSNNKSQASSKSSSSGNGNFPADAGDVFGDILDIVGAFSF